MTSLEQYLEGKNLRLYLVETDDDLRERVIVADVGECRIRHESNWDTIKTDFRMQSFDNFPVKSEVTLTISLRESSNGAFYRIENFNDSSE